MDQTEQQVDVLRRETFEVSGPLELDVAVGAGRIEVRLANGNGVEVEVRHAPESPSRFADGVANLMTWLSGQFGTEAEVSADDAVRETRIDLSGGRLAVHTPKQLGLRSIPLAVTVRAPAGSHLTARSGAAAMTVTGPAGRLDLATGSGDLNVDRADGAAVIGTGSGSVRLGPMLAGLRVRTGSGDVEVTSVAGSAALFTGIGDVWLGTVAGEVMARTGSGDLTVADAASGKLELITGSGEIRVGVRQGASASIDLVSGSGEARSELPLSSNRPADAPALQLRGRTGSGNAVVTAAVE